LNNSVVTA
jgi:hypothetical protein